MTELKAVIAVALEFFLLDVAWHPCPLLVKWSDLTFMHGFIVVHSTHRVQVSGCQAWKCFSALQKTSHKWTQMHEKMLQMSHNWQEESQELVEQPRSCWIVHLTDAAKWQDDHLGSHAWGRSGRLDRSPDATWHCCWRSPTQCWLCVILGSWRRDPYNHHWSPCHFHQALLL